MSNTATCRLPTSSGAAAATIAGSPLKQSLVVEYISASLEGLLGSHSNVPSPSGLGSPAGVSSSSPNLLSDPLLSKELGNSPEEGEGAGGVQLRVTSPATSSSPTTGGFVGSTNSHSRIKVSEYVQRLAKFLVCPLECLLAGLVLLQRLDEKSCETASSFGFLEIAALTASSTSSRRASPVPEQHHSHQKMFEDDTSEDEEEEKFLADQLLRDVLLFGKDKTQLLNAFLACTVIQIKLLCDFSGTILFYASVGGVHPRVLRLWEVKVLKILQWGHLSVNFRTELCPLMTTCGWVGEGAMSEEVKEAASTELALHHRQEDEALVSCISTAAATESVVDSAPVAINPPGIRKSSGGTNYSLSLFGSGSHLLHTKAVLQGGGFSQYSSTVVSPPPSGSHDEGSGNSPSVLESSYGGLSDDDDSYPTPTTLCKQ